MHRFRFAILGAAAALTLGTAGAVAMEQSSGGGTSDPDQHGDAVASAARSCPHGTGDVHGDCVSAVASSKSEADENNAKVAACKAADQKEDAAEKAPAKGDKAAKAAEKAEDRREHAAFAACVSGGESETGETSGASH